MREAPSSLSPTDDRISDAKATQVQTLVDHLTSVSPQAALLSRVLCNAHAHTLLASLSGIELWDAKASPVEAEDPGVITIGSIAGPLRLEIDLAAYPALQILAHGAHAGVANALHNATASVLLAGLLEQMALAGLGIWRVIAIERGTGAERLADLALGWLGRVHRVGISAPESTLTVFEQRVHSLARDGGPMADTGVDLPFSSLRLPGRVVIGQRSLPVAALQALRPGDVLLRVLTPATAAALRSADTTAFRARAAWGASGMTRVAASVSIEGAAIIIIEEPFMTDVLDPAERDQAPFDEDLPDQQDRPDDEYEEGYAPQADSEDSPDPLARPVPVGELELPLQLEIDTVALPLAQIAALRPGYVLELQVPVRDARIRLVTHGQTIGHGELVALGEHLGIRILRMAHGDGSVQ